MNERRIARIQGLIKTRVAEVIDRDLADPRRGLVTVTRVKVDRELQTCVVYWTVYGPPAERSKNAAMLKQATPFVRREVGRVLHARTVPEIRFEYDDGLEEAQRVEEILDELRDERGADGEGAE